MARLGYRDAGMLRIGAEQGNCVGLWGVAVHPRTNRVYVTNVHTPDLAVIDGDAGEFVKVVRLTPRAEQLCVDICYQPANERLYTTSHVHGRIWTVDARAERLVAEHAPGAQPGGVASDPLTGKTYVALGGGDGAVAVLDREDRFTNKIPVRPWPYPVAVDPERHRAYVVSQMAQMMKYQNYVDPAGFPVGVLNVIDTRTDEVVGEVEVERRSQGIAVHPRTGLVYVSNRVDDTVLVVDPDHRKVVKRLKVRCNPLGICAHPHRDKVYVVNLLGDWYDDIGQPAIMSVIDSRRNEVVKHIPVGKFSTSVAVNPTTGLAYVPNEDDMDVSVIDTDRDEEIRRIPVPGITVDGMEFNPRTRRMYVPAHFAKAVRTVDTERLEVVGDVPFGGWGVACAVNEPADRVYFNNSQRGTVHVIDGKTNREVTHTNLGVGCNLMRRFWAGIACDPGRGGVYAALARLNGLSILRDEPEANRLLLLGRVVLGPLIHQDPGQFPGSTQLAVAANRATGEVYAYNTFHRVLSKVDADEFKVAARLDLSGVRLPAADLAVPVADRNISRFRRRYSASYVLAVDERRDIVYAHNVAVDGATMRVRGLLPMEKVTGVQAVDDGKRRLYAHGARGMTVLDADTYEEMLFIPHGNPEGEDVETAVMWGVDAANGRVYLQRHLFAEGNELRVMEVEEPVVG